MYVIVQLHIVIDVKFCSLILWLLIVTFSYSQWFMESTSPATISLNRLDCIETKATVSNMMVENATLTPLKRYAPKNCVVYSTPIFPVAVTYLYFVPSNYG